MFLSEPTTSLTDVVLGLECFWLSFRLLRGHPGPGRWMGGALAATGASALLGAVVHGFGPRLAGTAAATLLWTGTLWLIGITTLLFLTSVVRAWLRPAAARAVIGVAGLQLIGYLAWTTNHPEFFWAIVEYVPAMAFAFGLAVWMYARGERGAGDLILGILLLFFGAAVQALGFGLHRHFNHNDLFHVIQMFAVWFLARAGARMRREAYGLALGR